MAEIVEWLGHGSNAKTFVLILFSVTFVGLIIYVFSGKKRAQRFESYKNIPFLDDEHDSGHDKDLKQ